MIYLIILIITIFIWCLIEDKDSYEPTKEEAIKEINEMIKAYKTKYNGLASVDGQYHGAFLVGSSICNPKNKGGDSARFWYLKNIIDKND